MIWKWKQLLLHLCLQSSYTVFKVGAWYGACFDCLPQVKSRCHKRWDLCRLVDIGLIILLIFSLFHNCPIEIKFWLLRIFHIFYLFYIIRSLSNSLKMQWRHIPSTFVITNKKIISCDKIRLFPIKEVMFRISTEDRD